MRLLGELVRAEAETFVEIEQLDASAARIMTTDEEGCRTFGGWCDEGYMTETGLDLSGWDVSAQEQCARFCAKHTGCRHYSYIPTTHDMESYCMIYSGDCPKLCGRRSSTPTCWATEGKDGSPWSLYRTCALDGD